MPKHVLQLRCPCCKKPLEIDTRTGRARVMAAGDAGLEALLEEHKSESERLGGLFDSAREQADRDRERLDELFRKAADDAGEDKGTKPRSPFDFE